MRKQMLRRLCLGITLAWGLFLLHPAMAGAALLQNGSTGAAVLNLQQRLTELDYAPGPIDGIYGPRTEGAVAAFQQAAGLTADGLAGDRTAAALHLSPDTFAPLTARTFWVTATAYCPCARCNYPYGGQPSYLGYPLAYGIAAVDPAFIPMGSRLSIPGYGEALAADQGNAIKGAHIDLCFETHQKALDWGIRQLMITVYE